MIINYQNKHLPKQVNNVVSIELSSEVKEKIQILIEAGGLPPASIVETLDLHPLRINQAIEYTRKKMSEWQHSPNFRVGTKSFAEMDRIWEAEGPSAS